MSFERSRPILILAGAFLAAALLTKALAAEINPPATRAIVEEITARKL